VAERAGNIISLFEGSYENIKITTQEDLVVAEALMGKKY
jgi:2-C-methyl-D-erythritol 4-phosphate cytidylyltransferase